MNKKEKMAVVVSIAIVIVITASIVFTQTGLFGVMTNDEIDQQQTIEYGGWIIYSGQSVAQEFVPSLPKLTRVHVYLKNVGGVTSPPIIIHIRDDLDHPDLASGAINPSDIGSGFSWFEIDFPDIDVTPGESYYIVWTMNIEWDAGYHISEGRESSSYDYYPSGSVYTNYNDGSGWQWASDVEDTTFKTWGYISGVNNDPILFKYDAWDYGVEPDTGNEYTTFDFRVHYYDEDGDAPVIKSVTIDGNNYGMSLSQGSSYNGDYLYSKSGFSVGVHQYYFYFTDGNGGDDRLPAGTWSFEIIAGAGEPPVADVDGPYSGDTGELINFDAGDSYDPDGSVVGYRWDWDNDGVWDTIWLSSPTTQHSYSAAGTYVVKLEVKDNEGATDTDMAIVTIIPAGPDYPQVKTLNATDVGSDSAVLTGYLQDLGGASSCNVWFVYDVESHDSWSEYLLDTSPVTRTSIGLFEKEITGLSSGTEYHFRAVASNDAGNAQGADEQFETSSIPWTWLGIGSIVAIVGTAGIWYWKKRKSV